MKGMRVCGWRVWLGSESGWMDLEIRIIQKKIKDVLVRV